MNFSLSSPYKPSVAQEKAIDELCEAIEKGSKYTTLLGVTGSGKTFVMANVIARLNRPTLILSHNKTLAAQLFEEYSDFFPNNAVKYFVSYYDYYQPEAYVPTKDLYIEKESDVNKEIERFRLSAITAAMRRRDLITVASVSCIYSIGDPKEHEGMAQMIEVDKTVNLSQLLRDLATLQYQRNNYDFMPGSFRLKGDILEIFPPYDDYSVRIELFGEHIERIVLTDPLTGSTVSELEKLEIFPAKNFVVSPEMVKTVISEIRHDLEVRLKELNNQGKLLEAQRLEQRTNFDLEMLEQAGYCTGIENYSRYFEDREKGDPPFTLIDYFPKDFLMIIDESHITIPQVGGMSEGDRSRKQVLVDYGFRLPSALDNRPLNFREFQDKLNQTIFTSATPSNWEREHSTSNTIELVVRPTGLLDPTVQVKKTENQIDDVIAEVKKNTEKQQRTLITTLTKRMAEDLTNYLKEVGIKVQYLHSDVDTVERIDILRDLRLGVYDVVVGINLLREGIDLPEVSLVIILDADKEGFLRSERSLIQTMGRAARHVEGRVIMYADNITGSMTRAIRETQRRRRIQEQYNKEHGIIPKTIEKKIRNAWRTQDKQGMLTAAAVKRLSSADIKRNIKMLEEKMYLQAQNLEYEKAAETRDQIKMLKQHLN